LLRRVQHGTLLLLLQPQLQPPKLLLLEANCRTNAQQANAQQATLLR